MRKTFLFTMMITGIAMSLVGCSNTEAKKSSTASLKETKTYSVYAKTKDTEDAKVDITYFNERPDVGYISIDNGLKLYKVLRANYYFDNTWDYDISNTTKDGNVTTTVTNKDNKATFVIDTENNLVKCSNLDEFTVENGNYPNTPASSYGPIVKDDSTSIDLIAWCSNSNQMNYSFVEKYSDGEEYDLGKYNISLYSYNNESYMPFATFNDFFFNQTYAPLSILKNGVYGVTSTKDLAEAISGQGLDITKDLLQFNYDEIRFTMDYFYGFSEEAIGRDFDRYCTINGLKSQFLESAYGADMALNTVVTTLMDDGHTNFLAVSPSNTETFTQTYGQEAYKSLVNSLMYKSLRTSAYPNGVPAYQEIGSTAIITFDRFTEEPKDLYSKGIPTTVDDTTDAISLFIYAYAQITRENSPITAIVVDESMNGGGDAKCADYLGAMLCGGSVSLYTRNTLTGNKTAAMIVADCNLDGKFDENDHKLTRIPTYILTSPCSFSCGNFLPSLLKQKTVGYICGQRSGGGSNVVSMRSSAIGTAYRMSGTTQLCRFSNGKFYNIDDGVEVDIPVQNTHMYSNNRADLLADLGLEVTK